MRIIAYLLVLVLVGCSHLPFGVPRSVCDEAVPGESVLCDLARECDVRLETMGDLVMVANLRAIEEGAYAKGEAIEVFLKFQGIVNLSGIKAVDLKGLAMEYVDEYPELILLSPYVGYLDMPKVLTDRDVEFLNYWINQQIGLLGGM